MWDKETTFSTLQTLVTGGADSTDVVDAGPGDIGLGEAVYLQVSVTPGCTGTLTVQVKTADTADMTGAVKLAEYLVGAVRLAKGGPVLAAPLPTGCKRYLRLNYAGAAGGKITAGLAQGAQTAGMR